METGKKVLVELRYWQDEKGKGIMAAVQQEKILPATLVDSKSLFSLLNCELCPLHGSGNEPFLQNVYRENPKGRRVLIACRGLENLDGKKGPLCVRKFRRPVIMEVAIG